MMNLAGRAPQPPEQDQFTIVQSGHGADMLQFKLQITSHYTQAFWVPVPKTVDEVQSSIGTLREPIQCVIDSRSEREAELSSLKETISTMPRISVEVVDIAYSPLPLEVDYERSRIEITYVALSSDRLLPHRSVLRAFSSDEAIEGLQARAMLDEDLSESEATHLENGASASIDSCLLERLQREASDPQRALRLILKSDTATVECRDGLPNFKLRWGRGVIRTDDAVMLDLQSHAIMAEIEAAQFQHRQ